MAVAWSGNRETLVARAADHAAGLLRSSRCPVFSIDTDIHGTRAAVALAERVGAALDHVEGDALAREAALFTDKGAMTIAPGEARRRADVVVVVGDLPQSYHAFVAELAATVPDLSSGQGRAFFFIDADVPPEIVTGTVVSVAAGSSPPRSGGEVARAKPEPVRGSLKRGVKNPVACTLAATLAALRARLAVRKVAAPVENFDLFAAALAAARFPVFLFSGHGADSPALEMLQGLVADLNRTGRASSLHLPASEGAWGSALAATWMTGFPLRTSFARGFPEYDPWRFDAARMIASGEADLHLWISTQLPPAPKAGMALIALARTQAPAAGAAVTIAIGEAGIDHDAVAWSARTGSLAAIAVRQATALPSAAAIVRLIAAKISAEAALPC